MPFKRKGLKELNSQSALALSLRLITLRSRSSGEIRDKLKARGCHEELIDETVQKLTENGFINDEAFARELASSRARNKRWGKIKIRAELRSKGLERGIIDEALKGLEEDENEVAVEALRQWLRRGGNKKSTGRALTAKAFRFLASRGFNAGISGAAIKKTLNENIAESTAEE